VRGTVRAWGPPNEDSSKLSQVTAGSHYSTGNCANNTTWGRKPLSFPWQKTFFPRQGTLLAKRGGGRNVISASNTLIIVRPNNSRGSNVAGDALRHTNILSGLPTLSISYLFRFLEVVRPHKNFFILRSSQLVLQKPNRAILVRPTGSAW